MIESILPLIESNSNYLAVSQFLVCLLFTSGGTQDKDLAVMRNHGDSFLENDGNLN